MNRFSLSLLIVPAFLLLVGCGREVPDHPATYPVTGVITQGGKPIAGVDVSFIPVSQEGETRSARGMTDDDGRYELHTYFSAAADIEGAVPGEYKVTLFKRDLDAAPLSHGSGAPGGRQAYTAGVKLKSSLPEQYSKQETTPLTATVKEGDNTIELQVE